MNIFDFIPKEAWDYFKAKGLKTTFSYMDMVKYEHDKAFTVAKLMDIDLLSFVQEQVEKALVEGLTFQEFQMNIKSRLQEAGWWGEKDMKDPLTGKIIKSQLGSASRLYTIFDTNLKTSYAKGQIEGIEAYSDTAPYLLYTAILDARTRPLHREWDKIVLRYDDPWWKTHYPPCGYRCRCGVIQITEEEVAELGLKISGKAPNNGTYDWKNPRTGENLKIPMGTDPLFDKNIKNVDNQILNETINSLHGELGRQAKKWLKKNEKN